MVDEETMPLEMLNLLQEFKEKICLEKDLHPSDYSEKDVQLLYTIAHKYYSNGAYMEAETFFLRLVLARATEIIYWRGLGSCYQMQKKYLNALTIWGMCASIDNNDINYHLYGAECLIHLKQIDQAKLALNHVKDFITYEHPTYQKYEKVKNLIDQGVSY
jgi:tetratricopeptide (TPR) repeat protein